jgi:ornithine cyclodeaminase/alanine dehydrogenase-like protein (mu-crystallin family)
MTIFLTNDDVRGLLTVPECIDVMEDAYRELGANQAAYRDRLELIGPSHGIGDFYMLKTVDGLIPSLGVGAVRITSDIKEVFEKDGKLRRRKIPAAPGGRYTSFVLVFSTETTEPLLVYADGFVNPTRVAATTALGVKYLARENAKTVALFGSGNQADKQVAAVAAVRDLDVIKCFSPTKENCEAFAKRTSKAYGTNVVPVTSQEEAIDGADIILCATNSQSPIYTKEWMKPGQHFGCIKSSEMDPQAVRDADIAICHTKIGESPFATTHGIDEQTVNGKPSTFAEDSGIAELPTIADVICGNAPGRDNDEQITGFVNTLGIGLQFTAVGALLYKKAKEQNAGNDVPTDWLTQAEMS